MSQELADAVWVCYKADDTDKEIISSLAEQRALVRKSDNDYMSDGSDRIDTGEDD